MNIKYFNLILFLVFIYGCSSYHNKIIKSNKCFKELFTPDGFAELEFFLDKFELFLEEKIGKDKIVENYDGYFDFVKQNGIYGMDTNYVAELIEEFSEPMRSKIWYLSDGFVKVPGEHRKTKEKKFFMIRDTFKSHLVECSCVEEEEMEKLKVSVHFSKLDELYNKNKNNMHLNFSIRLYIALEFLTRIKNSY